MNIQSLFTSAAKATIGSVLDGASNIISKFKADPTKVVELEQELNKLRIDAELKLKEMDMQLEQKLSEERANEDAQVSDRWKSDLTSDSSISKLSRPITLLSMLAFMMLIIVSDSIDGWHFDVKPAYIDLIQSLLITIVCAYFGSRGFEKYHAIKSKK